MEMQPGAACFQPCGPENAFSGNPDCSRIPDVLGILRQLLFADHSERDEEQMTKLWKRSLSMFLALVMVIGMLPLNVLADDAETDTAESIVVEQSVETQAPPTESPAEPPVTEAPATQAATEPAAETEAIQAVVETEAATEPVQTQPTEDASDAVTDVQATDEAALANSQEEAATIWEYTAVPDVDGLPSDEELFRGYAEGVLYGSGAATFGTFAGDRLDGDLKLAYDALVPVLKEIASGKQENAAISIGDTFEDYTADVAVAFEGSAFSEDQIVQTLGTLLDALLADLPYDLYWFDKVAGVNLTVVEQYTGEINATFKFTVSAVYQNGDDLTVNTGLTGAASDTVDRAKAVVDQVKAAGNSTDYDILKAYKNWICDNVSYDHDAAASNGSGGFQENSDPWQVIYVFDGDTSTNVVCEGYSKAFQYLCDLTNWSGNVECYSVSGELRYTGGYGPHMWNIVKLEGAYYLVDVTNCDTETGTEDNSLFLMGGKPKYGSYTFAGCTFTYDDDTHALWDRTGVLTLSESRYGGFTQADLLAEIAAAVSEHTSYDIPESVTLESSCTINTFEDQDYWDVYVPEGVTLTVPADVTLTVEGALILNGGSVVVEEGGKLVIGSSEAWGDIYLWGGSLSIADKAAPTITNGLVIVELGSGYVLDAAVPKKNLHAQAYINSETELRDVLNTTEFSSRDIYVQSSFDITSDLTLEAGDFLCLSNDPVVTVKEGVTLAIEAYATLLVPQGSILVNNGTITVDTDGSLTGNGEFQNNGTLNGKHTIVAAERETMTQQEFMDAIENSDGFYSLRADVTIESDCTLPEGYTVWVQPSGSLTVAAGATLTVDGQLSTTNGTITVDGTLINNGYISLSSEGNRGSIVINGKLENNRSLDIYSGTLTFNGTYIGGGSVELDCVNANLVGADKIGKDNISVRIIAKTEDALFTAMDSTLAEGYASYSVQTDADITLTKNLTIPQDIHVTVGYSYSSDGGQYQHGLTVPQGITLTNKGSIYVVDYSYLRVNEGATLNNQGGIEVAGQLENKGTVTGAGTITGDGEIIGVAAAESLADRFAAAAANGEDVELTTAVRLDADLDVEIGGQALRILDGGSIVVPSGVTLTITDPVVLEGGLIKVENGGTLQVNGTLTITSGTVYIADGGTVNQADGITLPDGILYGADMTPYLTCRWLRNDGEGWYENPEEELYQSCTIDPMATQYLIFYRNTWDEDSLSWVQTPVVPSGNYYLAVQTIQEQGWDIAANQKNGEYFVTLTSQNTLDEQAVSLTANGCEFPVTIRQMDLGFFTSQYPNLASYVDDFFLETGKTNEFYLVVVPDDVTATVENVAIGPDFYEPDYRDTLLSCEEVTPGRVWKFTVDSEFVEYLACSQSGNFCVNVDTTITYADGSASTYLYQLMVEPPEPEIASAVLHFGENAYLIYDNGIILWEHPTDDGNYLREKGKLPDGVSYDPESNTLTLEDVEEDALFLSYLTPWEDPDTGETFFDQQLPNPNLTLELVGSNTLSSTGDYALSINNGANVTIQGGGTLTLDAGLGNSIYVDEDSTVTFASGTVNAGYGRSDMHGEVIWNGTVFNGLGSEILADGDFSMNGGEINLTGDQYKDTNGETVERSAKLAFEHSTTMNGGSVTIQNGTLSNTGTFSLDGGTITIENDREHTDLVGVENVGELTVNGGELNSSVVRNAGILNTGTLTQNGGTVKVAAEDGEALSTCGSFLLFDGEMNLSGFDGLNLFTDPENTDEEYVALVQITGGTLNIEAQHTGIAAAGALHLAPGAQVDINAKAKGDFTAYGIYLQEALNSAEHNVSNLVMIGGKLNLTSSGVGLAVENTSVSIEGYTDENGTYYAPEITIDADAAAVSSLSNSLSNTNFCTEDGKELAFRTANEQYLTLTSTKVADGYLHSVESDGMVSVVIRGFTTLAAFQAGMKAAAAKDEPYVLEDSLVLNVSLSLTSDVILADGITLTVAKGKTLTIPANRFLATNRGGALIVEGILTNKGSLVNDGGTVTVNGTYNHSGTGARVTGFLNDGFLSPITGIPTSIIDLDCYCSDYDVITALDYAEQYRTVTVYPGYYSSGTEGITISENLTVRENATILAWGCPITIAEGATVQLDGRMELGIDDILTVDGALINNNVLSLKGTKLLVNGSFQQNGVLETNEGITSVSTGNGSHYDEVTASSIEVNGTFNNTSAGGTCLNYGAEMQINGTLNNYVPFHVGYDNGTPNYDDYTLSRLTIGDSGVMNNYSFLNVCVQDVVRDEDGARRAGGYVDVSGTLNNRSNGYVEVHGNMSVYGSVYNDSIFRVYGNLWVHGKFTNGYHGYGVAVYGEMGVYGTLDNNGGIQLYDAANLYAYGATISNHGTIRCSNKNGCVDMYATLNNSDGVILVDYFDDGTTVQWSGSTSELTLFYEGNSEESIRDVIRIAAEEGYRDYQICINGNLTLSGDDLAIAYNGTLEVLRGSTLTVNNAIINDGSLRVYGSMIINQTGFVFNAGNLLADDGGQITVKGELRNESCGCISISDTGSCVTSGYGFIENKLDSETSQAGTITGTIAGELHLTTEVTTEEQLRAAIDKITGEGYSFGGIQIVAEELVISSDLYIPENVNVWAAATDAEGNDVPGMTVIIGENVVVTCDGYLNIARDTTLLVNGALRVQNGSVQIVDGATLMVGSAGAAYSLSDSNSGTARVVVGGKAKLDVSGGEYILGEGAEIIVSWANGQTGTTKGVEYNDMTLQMVVSEDPASETTVFNVNDFNSMNSALKSKGYRNAQIVFEDDYTFTNNFTIPENVELIVDAGATVTVDAGIVLTNNGSINASEGTLNVVGYMGGNGDTSGNVEQVESRTQEWFLAELKASEGRYSLNYQVVLSENLTLATFPPIDIGAGGQIVVPSGVTLTIEGSVYVSNSGKLSVLSGGKLVNNDEIYVMDTGYVQIKGSYTQSANARFLVSPAAVDNVSGVPNNKQCLLGFAGSEDALHGIINTCTTGGYLAAYITAGSMELKDDLTIPKNVWLYVDDYGTAQWVISEGVTVELDGAISVLEGYITNNGTLSLNKGSLLYTLETYEGKAPVNNGGTILPSATAVTILEPSATTFDIAEVEGRSCELQVQVSGEEAYETLQYVTWTSSNKNIVDPANIVDNQDGTYTVTFGNAVGDVKLTATTIDGSKKTASITLTTYYLDTANKITAAVDVPAIGLQPGQQVEMHVSGSEELNSDDLVFTSSNEEIATVEDGVITGGTKTGTARITAAIKDDPLKRSVTVSVKVIPAQIECLDLAWIIDDQEAKQLDLEVDESAARTYILKPRPVYPTGVNGSDLTKSSFKWTSSDTKLATVTANTDGSATVTIKAGADGVCNITAVSNDLNKASAVAPITVKDYSPRLGASSVTLNPKLTAGAEVALVESYGNAIQSVAISDDRLDVNYDSGILTVSKKEGVDAISNCTINAVLTVETKLDDVARNYEYNLKVTVKNTVPSVTVKQTGKVDLFYTDSTASLSVTVKDAVVENVMLMNPDDQDFALDFDEVTGICTVGFSDNYKENHDAKPVTKVTLLIALDGYAVPVEKTVTIGTTTSKISLSTDPTSSTVNTDPTYGTSISFCIYNKTTKATEVFDTVMVNGVKVIPETDGRINVELNEAVEQTLTIEVSNDKWMQSVTLKHTVNVTSAVPTVKLGASTLKLSTVFPMQSVATSVSLNQSNLAISDFSEFITTAKEGTAAYDEAQKLNVYYDDAEAKIVASFANAEEMPKTGTYTFTGTPEINGKLLTKSVTIRVTVNTAVPTVKLSATTLKLNSTLAGLEVAAANATMTNSTGLDLKLVGFETTGESVIDTAYDGITDELTVILKENTATGKYVYDMYPVVADTDGNQVTLPKAVKLTVNVYESNITVSQSASGKLDAIDPASAIVYTVSKINNAIGKIEDVTLGGVDADKFQAELGANTAGKQTITLKMKPGEVYNTKTTYKVNLLYTICGEEVPSSALSVKVTQSTPKLTATTVQYYQSQQDNPAYGTLTLTTPASAEIGSISVNQTKTSKELIEALVDAEAALSTDMTDTRNVLVKLVISNPGSLVAGKSYNLYLDVTPAGCAENVAPTAVKVTVKVAK